MTQIITAETIEEAVSANRIGGHNYVYKFGRNDDVDTGPEDVWAGQGEYTGHDATANEDIEVLSGSAADAGTVVSSGTATGGSATTLVDTGATFSTDGVAAGDVVLNDTDAVHGFVSAVDSETQLTVHRMGDGEGNHYGENASGDSYRVVTPASTGASVVRIQHLLDEDYSEQTDQYVVMNGVSGVTVTGNYIRCSRARVVAAGSGGINAGSITIRQATTTANVFAVMPSTGQTTIGAGTIPEGKVGIVQDVKMSISKSGGSAGSAVVALYVRERGGAWNGRPTFDVTTNYPESLDILRGVVIPPGSDYKIRAVSVSSTNTIVQGIVRILYRDIDTIS